MAPGLRSLTKKLQQHDQNFNKELLKSAFYFAKKAHKGQFRHSGEPYFTHPLAVAQIVADLTSDTAVTIAALLHDVVEDTDVCLETIKNLFGDQVAKMVDGVTKISKTVIACKETRKTASLNKLTTAIESDRSIGIIKLADRLHNMETICYVKCDQKRRNMVQETTSFYLPLAKRINAPILYQRLEELTAVHL